MTPAPERAPDNEGSALELTDQAVELICQIDQFGAGQIGLLGILRGMVGEPADVGDALADVLRHLALIVGGVRHLRVQLADMGDAFGDQA